MAPNLDTIGVFGRSIAEVTACFTALADPRSATDTPSRPRVGVLPSAFEGADAAVYAACDAALKEWEAHGAELVEVDMPWPRRGLGKIYSAELAASWTDRIETDDPRLLPTVRAGLEHGREVDAVSYVRAVQALELVRAEAAAAIADLDVVVGPTSPIVAPPLGDPDPTAMAGRNTRVFNGLGWPSISIPLETADLPVGLQLATVSGDDRRLLAIASQLADLIGS
jgi:aspartyl-tRNA(Asn)/glutamyl-tRNA(Gln) amidotransferase subunit A